MSTIDYIMVRRDEIRTIKHCKVIPGECVATQHRLVVMEMNVVMTRKPRPRIKQQKTKWRNLEKDEFKLTFLPKALEILASVTQEMNYEELEANLLQLANEELGERSDGGQFIEKETYGGRINRSRNPQRLRKMLFRSDNLVERNKIMSSIKSRKGNPKKM